MKVDDDGGAGIRTKWTDEDKEEGNEKYKKKHTLQLLQQNETETEATDNQQQTRRWTR